MLKELNFDHNTYNAHANECVIQIATFRVHMNNLSESELESFLLTIYKYITIVDDLFLYS